MRTKGVLLTSIFLAGCSQSEPPPSRSLEPTPPPVVDNVGDAECEEDGVERTLCQIGEYFDGIGVVSVRSIESYCDYHHAGEVIPGATCSVLNCGVKLQFDQVDCVGRGAICAGLSSAVFGAEALSSLAARVEPTEDGSLTVVGSNGERLIEVGSEVGLGLIALEPEQLIAIGPGFLLAFQGGALDRVQVAGCRTGTALTASESIDTVMAGLSACTFDEPRRIADHPYLAKCGDGAPEPQRCESIDACEAPLMCDPLTRWCSHSCSNDEECPVGHVCDVGDPVSFCRE